MNETLINQVKQCPTLPSLPAVAIQVLELAQKEEVDINEIARVITQDPALSSKILKTVNSSFYGRSQSIATISHALVILGLQSVKTLVLGFSLVSNLKQSKSKGFSHVYYWRRSVYSATAARVLASKASVVQQEECFLAALLKDIGMLVLDQVLGEKYSEIYDRATSHIDLAKLEAEALGMSHAEVSGILAEQWKLPPLLSVPLAFHHRVEQVTDPALRKLTELVSTAGRCADVFVEEHAAATAISDVRKACKQYYNMEPGAVDVMLNDICNKTKEVAQLFDISIQAGVSYDKILKQANEALVELTLRSQAQASSLQQQNQQLKIQAETDGLTGMANRATFDRFIRDQFSQAVATAKPLAVLMMDIDKFKSINDTHGHPAGDEVLRQVSALLKSAARQQDMAARYGGEEFVLILPGTNRAMAATIAESIRRAIQGKPITLPDKTLNITASIGVACYEVGSPFKEAAQLLKAADMGVYAAKNGGRNAVRVFAVKPAAA